MLIVGGFLPLVMLFPMFWIMHAEPWFILANTLPVAFGTLFLAKTIQSWTDPRRRYRYLLDDQGIRVESTLTREKVIRKVSSWQGIHTVDIENGGIILRGKWGTVLPMPFECFESVEQRDEVVALAGCRAVNAGAEGY